MILAAGLGTRLRPWTLSHPKALVPVGGVPMLERVILRLRDSGFTRIVVNVHHFGDQIIDFLAAHDFGVEISVSDERGQLLDTGGGILHAGPLLDEDREPFLVHNVDILSDAPLERLIQEQARAGRLATLLVSRRESGRRLGFGPDMSLRGWHDLRTGAVRPAGYSPADAEEFAFSGIYALSVDALADMKKRSESVNFPIMDYFLDMALPGSIGGLAAQDLRLIDIGKPETLSEADSLFCPKRD